MRLGSVVMFVVAVLLAGLAGVLAKTWIEQQRAAVGSAPAPVLAKVGKIVVATQPLRFGAELSAVNVREIDWAVSAIPAGAFTSAADLFQGNERRVVLSAIEADEPILKAKITGPGQRASLSSLIDPGMKAVTIRVNDVFGVAGFVLPGDRVDLLFTRTDTAQGDSRDEKSFTDVLLQAVRVLGIDQLADDRAEQPSVVKAVTIEVDTADAQKVALASTVGSLSLVLRPAGSMSRANAERITANDLGSRRVEVASVAEPPLGPAKAEWDGTGEVSVTRALRRTVYRVTVENP